MSLISAAKGFIKKGISVVATDQNKRAIVSWKPFQEALPTVGELIYQFGLDKAHGLAIICGKVSGNLEVIDVDIKYDVTGQLFENLMALIHDVSGSLSDKLMIIQTRSGGYHIYYKCEIIQGNQKLAQRPATPEEIKENPNEKVLVLIETRGEGGYVVAPPTDGYKLLTGTSIQQITTGEREALLEIARSFNQYVIEQPKPPSARTMMDAYALTPWEDYNKRGIEDMMNRLQAHGWTIVSSKGERTIFKRPGNTESKTSGDYHWGHNLFTVFTTSSVFEPLKGYRPAAVFTMLEHNGDFSLAAKNLSLIGYGEKKQVYDSKVEREVFKKKREGFSSADLVNFLKKELKKEDQEAADILNQLEKQWGENLCTFWEIQKDKLQISRNKLERFLCDIGGFALYFYDPASNIYRLVKVGDGFVEEASTEQIKKFIKGYVNSLPDNFDGGVTPGELLEVVYKGSETYFSKSFFEFLDHINPDLLKDTAEEAFFPFRNGVVVVTRDNVVMKSYKEIGKVIWKSQVIDFNFSIDQTFEASDCEFMSFITKICGDEEERYLYAMSLIGYLLHKYKDPARPYAVIFAEETDNEAEGGGTGKGILVKALSYLINTERVDGKNFKLDKNFAFQRVGLDTRLVSLEDVRRNVDFEGFFSIITEGITVEKKNKDELYIPFKDSPKILFTTNYTINNNSKAAQRRQKVLEFAPFFTPKYTPRDHFKHNLFDDWDADEWNRFYNLMFACVSMYLMGGVREMADSAKLKRKHIRLSFGEEFLDFWDHYVENGCQEWKPFKELYNGFMIENDFEKKDFSQKRFKKGLEIASQLMEIESESRRNRQASNRTEFRLIKNTENVHDAYAI
jgi:hypothetical protein